MFIKQNVTRANNTFRGRIPENITSISNVTKQKTTPGDIIVLVTSVLRNVGVGECSKGSKVVNIRFTAIEEFKWCPAS